MRRRRVLQTGALALLLGEADIARGATIVAVRVWPAPDYSRVTIESDGVLKVTRASSPIRRGWRWTSRVSTSIPRCGNWWPKSAPTTRP